MPGRGRKRKLGELSNDVKDMALEPSAKRKRRVKDKEEKSEEQTWKDERHLISSVYKGLGFSESFFQFWDWLNIVSDGNKPCDALSSINLSMVGPFQLLDKQLQPYLSRKQIMNHWRYYYDLPEFQTIIKVSNDDNGKHWGYWRDNPKDNPIGVVYSNGGKTYKVYPSADTLFATVYFYCDELISNTKKPKKKSRKKRRAKSDEEKESSSGSEDISVSECERIMESLQSYASDCGITLNPQRSQSIFKKRSKAVVAKCFHNFGIVVPMEDDIGYRPLGYSDQQLKNIFDRMHNQKSSGKPVNGEELDQLLTFINLADDEGDPGMGYELGVDFFCSHPMFQKHAHRLMGNAYRLLNRTTNLEILDTHLANRDRSTWNELANVSVKDTKVSQKKTVSNTEEASSSTLKSVANDTENKENHAVPPAKKAAVVSPKVVSKMDRKSEAKKTLADLSSDSD